MVESSYYEISCGEQHVQRSRRGTSRANRARQLLHDRIIPERGCYPHVSTLSSIQNHRGDTCIVVPLRMRPSRHFLHTLSKKDIVTLTTHSTAPFNSQRTRNYTFSIGSQRTQDFSMLSMSSCQYHAHNMGKDGLSFSL